MKQYLFRLGSALSRVLNVLIGGSPAYSLSARAAMSKKSWPKKFINALFFFQKDHCATALQWDRLENKK